MRSSSEMLRAESDRIGTDIVEGARHDYSEERLAGAVRQRPARRGRGLGQLCELLSSRACRDCTTATDYYYRSLAGQTVQSATTRTLHT